MSKILLVEDDQMIVEIYKKKFESVGLEVVNATTGKEVLKLAAESDYDLVLLDMVLPEMSGMEVLKELKMSGNYNPDLKVFIFSNLDKSEYEEETKNNGAEGFIGKTEFTPSQLAQEILKILNKYGEQKKNKERINGKGKNSAGKKKRILFIEDEKIFIEMFGKKLEDDGYEVEYAQNGAWGSRMAAENEYDLIITDMIMPAMTGDEIIHRIKMDDKIKDIPLIVLSASVSDEDKKMVEDMGITDFYEKTKIVPSDISRRVAELLK